MAESVRTGPGDFTVAEALEAAESLREALSSAGITLPSLEVDTGGMWLGIGPLVSLGRCNVETARHLTEVVRAGARAGAVVG